MLIPATSGKTILTVIFLAGFAKENTWLREMLEQAALGPDPQRYRGTTSPGFRCKGLGGHSGEQDCLFDEDLAEQEK